MSRETYLTAPFQAAAQFLSANEPFFAEKYIDHAVLERLVAAHSKKVK